MHASFLYLILVSLCGITNALRLPVVARDDMPTWQGSRGRHGIHTYMFSAANGDGDDLDIDNAKDIVYATNITLGGREFPIQLDTGSSDVWVKTPFPIAIQNQTDIQVNLTFGIGQASGVVGFTEMKLGDYTVPQQAFLNVTNATDFGAIFSNGIFGILGLSFDQGSEVFTETFIQSGTNSTAGRTFLSNVFAQNTSAPNIFTVLLGRTDDTDGPQEGVFTIGEYDDQYKDVANQPKLPRTPAQLHQLTTLPRWSVQMDGMKVNGQAFQFNQSSVSEAAPGKTVAVLDTGFTFSQIPPAAVDFIYKNIPGSTWNSNTSLYEIPCENTADLVFSFGGVDFPIDPLDITVVKTNNLNQTVCNNAFRAISLPPASQVGDLGLDMILGVSFLKNAYVSFDFGDWTPDNTTGVPFIQMLPTTDLSKAKDTFASIRQGQVSTNDATLSGSSNTTQTGSIDLQHIQVGKPRPLPRRQLVPRHIHDYEASVNAQAKPFINVLPKPNGHVRIIVSSHHRAPLRIPYVPHAVSHCANTILQSRGPVVLALLIGVAVLTFVTAIVGLVLAVHSWYKHRRASEAGYQPIHIKDEEEY